MIPGQMKPADPNELIFIAKVINSDDIENKKMSDKIDLLKDELFEKNEKMQEDLSNVMFSVQSLKSDFKAQMDEVKQLLKKQPGQPVIQNQQRQPPQQQQ